MDDARQLAVVEAAPGIQVTITEAEGSPLRMKADC